LPFGVVGTALGFLFVADQPKPGDSTGPKLSTTIKKFDYFGFLSLVITLTLLFVVIVSALFNNGSISSTPALAAMGAVAGVFFIAFLVMDGFVRNDNNTNALEKPPFLDLNLFKNMTFSNTVFGTFISSIARTNITYGFIFYFQGPYGLDPLTAGIYLM
jgi:hypothetical protein